MNVIFISNVLTPHQIPLCDELDLLPNVSFHFYESMYVRKQSLPIGWRCEQSRDYVIPFDVIQSDIEKYNQIVRDADVVIFGSGDIRLIKSRLALDKLTFIYSERIYKNWKECIKYPYHLLKFNALYRGTKRVFLLCASAFASKDYNSLGLFRDRAYKWGYFTKSSNFQPEMQNQRINNSEKKTHIMWCSRFLNFKHPELPVMLAARLKDEGYDFIIDMFGCGQELDETEKLANELHVSDVVKFRGIRPNVEILDEMRMHDIFLFTSDRGEGWGVVLNEAMSCGCTVIASDEIGSAPYLVKDGENGMIFKSGNIESLYEKVKFLIDNPEKRQIMSKQGVNTIKNLWSPRNAAISLYELITDLLRNEHPSIVEGPCSKV